jgi:hypothetical protein
VDEASPARFHELVENVLAPLILGGPLRPVRPFGARLAFSIGEQRHVADSDLRTRLDVARVRRARLIAPVDTLEPLGRHEFALAAGLNDLLQATNHEIGGRLLRGRYSKLLASVIELCRSIPAPHNVAEALARHAAFCRVLELVRKDTSVAWWTGSASFRGQRPPSRLLLWPGLRRVTIDERRVPLSDMCQGLSGGSEELFCQALGRWLSCSPLTDLGSLTRSSPVFSWSSPSLSLVATAPGRTLAWRLLVDKPKAAVLASLERATKALAPAPQGARDVAEAFVKEVTEGWKALDEARGATAAGKAAG